MKLLLLFTALTSLSRHANGYYPLFTLTASFFDDLGPEVDRKFVVDISDGASFVVDRDLYFEKTGINNTFANKYSNTFFKLYGFANTYNLVYNRQISTVLGILGQDRVKIHGNVVKDASFAVATRSMLYSDCAAQDLSGRYVAGRIGFARENVTEIDLKGHFLRNAGGNNLCLSVVNDDKGQLKSNVSLGPPVYNKAEVITSFKSLNDEKDKRGLWQVPLDLISIGRYRVRLTVPAVLSTTLDQIAVPREIFFAINEAINATHDEDTRRYHVDCRRKIPVNLGINGKLLKVPFEEWTVPYKGRCYTKIGMTLIPEYVLGNSFFSSNGVCLDFEEETITIFKRKRNGHPSVGLLDGDEDELIMYKRDPIVNKGI
ncbi:unnamed protein product [Bursaphelenchus xylophilus]|uniref:(pine wood nematode) hypothetical protein n=1 Tax=Bursaphelenchus xylophilus TaxID=6326 RepID=A0A1I7SC99_BURXY|nr:unnamed protein product [Bursaphelenchus xylophilus]CAG9094496.1 unnamed protein product [Bursaphelenchus xylophilus]